jgi:hypothetical protein
MRGAHGRCKISDDMDENDPLGREGSQAPREPGALDTDALDGPAIKRLYGVDPEARVDWAGIKNAFIKSGVSRDRIGEAFGVSGSAVGQHAKKECWVREVPTRPLPCGRKPATGPRLPRDLSPGERRKRRLLERLYKVLDGKMKTLEQRMRAPAPEGGQSAADAERDARTLSALARLYAKLVELDERASEQAKGSETEIERSEAGQDADRFRRDLALRLERLHQARDA